MAHWWLTPADRNGLRHALPLERIVHVREAPGNVMGAELATLVETLSGEEIIFDMNIHDVMLLLGMAEARGQG